jgi:sulfite reductase (NADPH) flavoprotein alpha-component
MLANAKIKIVKDLVADLSRDEIIWLNGYLAGIVAAGEESSKPPVGLGSSPSVTKITLAFGTETGNAKKLATSFAAKAKKSGIQVKLVALDQYRLTDLAKEEWFFTVISTQGEGEPPAGAKKFYDYLFAEAPSLSKLNFAVLALGDTSYPLFCKAGEDVDAQLQKLGGNRVLALQKCDVDYEEEAGKWLDQILSRLQNFASPTEASANVQADTLVTQKTKGKKYYEGEILANINLNGRGSKKETFHIEVGTDVEVEYEPGDALAIVPQNRKAVVEEIISLGGIDKSLVIETEKHAGTAEELLTNQLNICYLLTSTIKAYAEITQQQIPDTRMDLKDLLRIYPVKNKDQFVEIVKLLKPIAPRLYSISSSPAAHAGEVHITVSRHSFLLQEEQHFGLCSDFLGELSVGTTIRFYIHKNRAFKLPSPEKDMIMIGPGTGIAPFRSFIAERDSLGAEGKSWLFFGDQHFTTDFLYQTEWQSWLDTGSLSKMNVAFSRDQQEKVYVQHKLWQHREELVQWLDNGAYLYVCGAKAPMSIDVENMLAKILKDYKGITEERAVEYLTALKEEGRYQKDVY